MEGFDERVDTLCPPPPHGPSFPPPRSRRILKLSCSDAVLPNLPGTAVRDTWGGFFVPPFPHERVFPTCLECDSHSGARNRAASCLKMIGGGSDRGRVVHFCAPDGLMLEQ